eukprot:5314511-Prorocentrum_lima.AAC.1
MCEANSRRQSGPRDSGRGLARREEGAHVGCVSGCHIYAGQACPDNSIAETKWDSRWASS